MKSDFVKACRRYDNDVKAKENLRRISSYDSLFCPYKVETPSGKIYYKKSNIRG